MKRVIQTILLLLPLTALLGGCSTFSQVSNSFPNNFHVVVDEELVFDTPRIYVGETNLDNLRAMRILEDEGSSYIEALLARNELLIEDNENPPAGVPELRVHITEEKEHVRFHTLYHQAVTFRVFFQGRMIYCQNYARISRTSIDSQRVLVPLLNREIRQFARKFKKNFLSKE